MKLNIQLFADSDVTIETKIDTKSFDREIAYLESRLEDLVSTYEIMSKQDKFTEEERVNFEKLGYEIEKTENRLSDLYKKQVDLGDTSSSSGTGGILKSMAKWGLAIFSIRSAYMLIRRSASELAQQNDEIAGKINAIRGSITNMLAPVVEVIVNLVYRLLSYLNVITSKFLGIDLFKSTAKSGKSAVGSAKQLKKQLASFDEMNVLSDSSSGGGGGGGMSTPNPIDTSKFAETITMYQNMWNELLAIDRKDAKEMLLNSDKTWGLFKLGWFDTTQGIARFIQGIVDVFRGVGQIIQGIAEGNNKKIKEGVHTLVLGIFGIISGIGQFLLGIGEMAVGIVKGFLKEMYDGITNIFTKIRDAVNKKIDNMKKTLTDKFGNIGTILGNAFGDKFKTIFNVVLGTIESLLNKPINAINKLINTINAVPGINLGKLSTFKFPRLAKGGIINMPGKGTYVGGAIGGESGREGVLPLTDSQQMELLGEAIGRYITINASITNTMNGRIISRELQKINNESNFANNM